MTVWRVRDWMRLYEPDPLGVYSWSKFSGQYVRLWVNTNTDGSVSRAEVDGQRARIRREGDFKLLGIFDEILRMAMDRPRQARGYLLTHLNTPAGEADIAETLRTDVTTVGWALRALSRPEIGALEQIDWEPRLIADRPAEAAGDDPAGQADASAMPPGHGGDHPEVKHGDGIADGPANHESGAGPPGKSEKQFGANAATTDGQGQGQGQGKGASLAASGKAACAKREEKGGKADGEDRAQMREQAGQGSAPDPGRPPAETRPGGEHVASTSLANPSRPDSERGTKPPAGRADPAGDVTLKQRHDEPNQTPAETRPGGECDGVSRPPAPARPDCDDEPTPDEATWRDVRTHAIYPASWRTVRHDETGMVFGRVIYYQLGFPAAAHHLKNREVPAIAGQWADAIAIGLSERALLDLAERGIRKARVIQAKHGRDGDGIRKPGGVWLAWFKGQLQKSVNARVREAIA